MPPAEKHKLTVKVLTLEDKLTLVEHGRGLGALRAELVMGSCTCGWTTGTQETRAAATAYHDHHIHLVRDRLRRQMVDEREFRMAYIDTIRLRQELA